MITVVVRIAVCAERGGAGVIEARVAVLERMVRVVSGIRFEDFFAVGHFVVQYHRLSRVEGSPAVEIYHGIVKLGLLRGVYVRVGIGDEIFRPYPNEYAPSTSARSTMALAAL